MDIKEIRGKKEKKKRENKQQITHIFVLKELGHGEERFSGLS